MSFDKKTVLAIDDFSLNLLIIKEALAKDVNIYIAKSGPLALKMLQLIEVDLFLLDIQMPEMDGFEFLSCLRKIEKYKDTPVIFVTARDKENIVKEALSYDPVDYILKPFKQSVLREKILEILKMKEKSQEESQKKFQEKSQEKSQEEFQEKSQEKSQEESQKKSQEKSQEESQEKLQEESQEESKEESQEDKQDDI